MNQFGFKKQEHLKSRKAIESLFRNGRSFSVPPFRMIYREVDSNDFPALMGVAVPKRMIRKAVDRNTVKRRTREAYRLQKQTLYSVLDREGKKIELIFVYQSPELMEYRQVENAVQILLKRLIRQMETNLSGGSGK